MLINAKDILDESNEKSNKILRQVSEEVTIPLTPEDLETLKEMSQYLINSQNEKVAKTYSLRPGIGISAIQIGVAKRMFCIRLNGDHIKYEYGFINPEIIEKSEEMTYLANGEGCLSVSRDVEGLTPRHKWVIIRAHMYEPKSKKLYYIQRKFEGYSAICFQHEFDHLNGILFFDNSAATLPYKAFMSNDDDEEEIIEEEN